MALKMPDIIPTRQSRSGQAGACIPALLTQRTGNVIVSPAVVWFSRPAGNQDFRRAGLRGIGGKALALLESFGLAELVGAKLAVRRAVGRNRTYHAPGHHRGWLGQTRQTVGSVLRCIQGLLEQFPHIVEQPRILFARRRERGRSRLALLGRR